MPLGRTYEGSHIDADRFGNFLVQAYMGAPTRRTFGRRLTWGQQVRRAYLDVNRTLHGVAVWAERDVRFGEAAAQIENRIMSLGQDHGCGLDRAAYDNWHLETRSAMAEAVGDWTFRGRRRYLRPGQTQKWLNMTLKYLYVSAAVSDVDLRGAGAAYRYAHLPLDEKVLTALSARGCHKAAPWRLRWSAMDEDSYQHIQAWALENLAHGGALLDLDFELWQP